MKILIVEDSDYKYQSVQRFLDRKNISYDRAETYIQCMHLLLENEYDGIFLDMQFPIDDIEPEYNLDPKQGVYVLKEMKRCKMNIPVCVHTSFDNLDFSKEPLVKKYIVYNSSCYMDSEYNEFIDMLLE